MKQGKYLEIAGAVLLAFGLSACSSLDSDNRREMVASYTAHSIRLDGKLEDPAWQNTPAYAFVHAENQYRKSSPDIRKFFRNSVVEAGKVRLLWDEKYLYAGFELTDTDIVAEGLSDQQNHFRLGDTVEVFLKPENQSWYWELYVTPRSRKTAYFFLGRGLCGLPGGYPEKPVLKGLIAAASVKGTLNKSWDKDDKWTAEIAVPLSELTVRGEKLDQETAWLIFFGRYNYGRYLCICENSSFPLQRDINYHAHADYARLKLVK